jgi:6-phosphogluconolactonase (cycloisomerase 2 family)
MGSLPDNKFNRRDFLRAGAALAPACAFGLRAAAAQTGSARAAAAPAGAAPEVPQGGGYAYVGTYTPNGGGIYLFRVDAVSAALTQLQVFDDIRNPSWLALNPAQTRLYAISEIDNFKDTHGGAVVSYAIDAATMQLKRLNAVSSGGANPSHISVHPSGKFAFVANYGGNVAVFPIGPDGSLGEASDIRPGVGARHRARAVDDPIGQFANSDHDSPHPHMIASDAGGQFVIANDAGLDLTLIWRFDAQAGRLLPADAPVVAAPSGSAPRHFVFHPNGRIFYNLYEHDAKIAVYDYDGARGAMRFKQSITTLPPKFAGSNLSSEIIITADGRFLYASNRLHNAIAVFAVAADGQLRSVAENWVHADYPRHISIDPSGEFLYSCNQKGDSITSFRISPVSGTLSFTGRFEPVGSPAALVFVKPT